MQKQKYKITHHGKAIHRQSGFSVFGLIVALLILLAFLLIAKTGWDRHIQDVSSDHASADRVAREVLDAMQAETARRQMTQTQAEMVIDLWMDDGGAVKYPRRR